MRHARAASILLVALCGASTIVSACSSDETMPLAAPCSEGGAGEAEAAPLVDAASKMEASDASTKIPGPEVPLTSQASIAAVTINQGVEIFLTDSGLPTKHRTAPVVVGRPGIVRVYVSLNAGVTSADLGAELWIASPGRATRQFKDHKMLGAPSTNGDLASTIDFELPADAIQKGSVYRVYLTSSAGAPGSALGAQVPPDDSAATFEALDTGTLKIMIVPLSYQADGSMRVPDLSAARVAKMKDAIYRFMPLGGAELQVHAPVPFAETVTNGTFSRLLSFVLALRADEDAPRDLYYYGVIQPAATEAAFCMGSCIEGESLWGTSGTSDAESGAVGTPYDIDRDNRVFVHEMGHALGLSHSPCGAVAGADSRYPYDGGVTGSWGYDLTARTLVDPNATYDIMTYCTPNWISDFSYGSIGNRLAINALLTTY